jgi:hypothetical protein
MTNYCSDIDGALNTLLNSRRAQMLSARGPYVVRLADERELRLHGVTSWMPIVIGLGDAEPQPAAKRRCGRERELMAPPSLLSLRGGRGSVGGAAGGTRIHDELRRLSLADPAARGALRAGLSPFARAAYDALAERGLTIRHCELRLFDEQLRVGTAVDIVCTNRRREVFFIELKNTDRLAGFRSASGAVKQPVFADVMHDNSRLSFALMQIAVAQIIAFIRYSVVAQTGVLVVTPTDVHWVRKKKTQWTFDEMHSAHSQLCDLVAKRMGVSS